MQLRPGLANEINIKTYTYNTIHTNGIGTLENSLEASWKVIYIIIIQSCDISPRYLFRRKEGKYIQTPACKYFDSFIHNSYMLKKSQMINLRMDKNILVYPCSIMPAKSLQLCLTLCDPMDCSPPGSPVHGILQERILKWVDIPFSMGSSWLRDGTWVFYVSFIGRFFCLFFFYHQCRLGSPYNEILCNKMEWTIHCCMLQNILILKTTLLNKLDKNI